MFVRATQNIMVQTAARRVGAVPTQISRAMAGSLPTSSCHGTSLQTRDITYYTESHEYLKVDDDDPNAAILGITTHAQEQLGDIVFVDLPEKDQSLEAGDILASVESVKAASDVYAPLNCVVVEPNEALSDNPGLVNEDAEGEGWFAKLDLQGATDEHLKKQGLMTRDAYEELLKNEE